MRNTMPATAVPRMPNRPPVRRMSRRELQGQNSEDFDNSFRSMNRWPSRRPSHVPADMNNSWRPMEQPPRNPADDEDKDKCFIKRGWFWFFGGVFCLILIIATIAIVLGIVLPMTTTSAPNSDATPKMALLDSAISTPLICSSVDRGLIARLDETIPSEWILYSYNYSATQTTPTILFGFETDGTHVYYLDAVSVVDANESSIELLTDPSFENSTINATEWIQLCETICDGQIVSGSQCFESSGNCFMLTCPGDNSSISFLSQSFMATIGNTYTISFMLNHQGNSSGGVITFYVDII